MDPAAITILATQAVAIITPFLKKASETVIPKFAEEIYSLVKTYFEKRPPAEESLTDLENTPEDEDTQAAVRLQLKKAISEDDSFAAQLEEIVNSSIKSSPQLSVTAEHRGVAAGGNISGNVITGDVHGTVSISGSQETSNSKN